MIAQEVAYMDIVFGFAANKHEILFHEICSYTQLRGVGLACTVVICLHARISGKARVDGQEPPVLASAALSSHRENTPPNSSSLST